MPRPASRGLGGLFACALCTVGAFALSGRGLARSSDGGAERIVEDPRPQDLTAATPADVQGMVLTRVRSPRGERNLTIMAYPRAEDNLVSGDLNAGLGWEWDRSKKLCDIFTAWGERGNFLDVGANIGTFTLPVADCMRGGGRVLAVEGMPSIVEHLRAGILANNMSNVDLFPYAVGGIGDPDSVTMSLNPVNKGGSAVKGNKPWTAGSKEEVESIFHPPRNNGRKRPPGEKPVEVKEFVVPLTTADSMLHSNPAMRSLLIAKIDIEGHEGRFLQGAQELFEKYPPCFVTIELIPEWLERAGTPIDGVLERLAGFGYGGLPSVEAATHGPVRSKTHQLRQRDIGACVERVKAAASAA